MGARHLLHGAIWLWLVVVSALPAAAIDFFLTIGGGFSPQDNQASLEANVLFFQQVLAEEHRSSRSTATFFSDGSKPGRDLQVLQSPPAVATPATDFLAGLYSFRGGTVPRSVEYRNHRVPHVAGPIEPAAIRHGLQRMIQSMHAGDRLFIYVTAHGGSAKGRDKHNTSITCWDEQSISMREFCQWLDEVPPDVPVISIMAQCYCGGFAHTIFEDGSANTGLAEHLRVGFFAQQHDLPAAGCRPDIENDEEYSSFFWGAFVGRTRNGQPLSGADADGDGRVSLAEAHALALIVSDTIDIPLRTSEAFLRKYSRFDSPVLSGTRAVPNNELIGGDEPTEFITADPLAELVTLDEPEVTHKNMPQDDPNALLAMSGTLDEISGHASPENRRAVVELGRQLGFGLGDDVTVVYIRFEEAQLAYERSRRARFGERRGRGSSSRDLREELAKQWPELTDRESWKQSPLLVSQNQAKLFEQFQQLPGYAAYQANREKRKQLEADIERAELLEVKFRRLINLLESIVLAANLPRIATDDVGKEIMERYNQIVSIEQSYLEQH
jgi:hypothetical protein